MQEFVERATKRAVSMGAVSAALDRLEQKGFARSSVGEPSPVRGGKGKRLFSVTAQGVRDAAGTQGASASGSGARSSKAVGHRAGLPAASAPPTAPAAFLADAPGASAKDRAAGIAADLEDLFVARSSVSPGRRAGIGETCSLIRRIAYGRAPGGPHRRRAKAGSPASSTTSASPRASSAASRCSCCWRYGLAGHGDRQWAAFTGGRRSCGRCPRARSDLGGRAHPGHGPHADRARRHVARRIPGDPGRSATTVRAEAAYPTSARITDPAAGLAELPLRTTFVSDTFFQTFGASPAVGRLPAAADHEPGAPPVAAAMHARWRTTFAGAMEVVGRTIDANGVPVTIVGVLDVGFGGPFKTEDLPDLFLPAPAVGQIEDAARLERQPGRGPRRMRSAAVSSAARPSNRPTPRCRRSRPRSVCVTRRSQAASRIVARPARQPLGGDVLGALAVFVVLVGLIVLLAAANVANLLPAGRRRGPEARPRRSARARGASCGNWSPRACCSASFRRRRAWSRRAG
ncbi:MAG: ABC transporter permease [Vicinamibacterales bacterium]